MQKYDTGIAMTKINAMLRRDARKALGNDFVPLLSGNESLSIIRQFSMPSYLHSSPYIVKWSLQLESFLKKFKYEDDVLSDQEVTKATMKKFMDVQEKLPSGRPTSAACFKVLQRARMIVKSILSDYNRQEHLNLCYFGSRAAKGVPLRKSYLDIRVGTLTGSSEHCAWFNSHVVDGDPLFQQANAEAEVQRPGFAIVNELDLTLAPKTWKSKRPIMPNTVCGNYFTNGLGELISRRLKLAGLNIHKLQDRHKKLAQRYSKTRTHVTADLSSASDSFTSWLISMLVPRQWLKVLRLGRISNARFENVSFKLQSFMTMGIGFTFPLQTLLFYALIKAIGELQQTNGIFSVYGDDLIYPSSIHDAVSFIFSKLGFKLNDEKTFRYTHFRESCGGDYFAGVDVRAAIPESEQQRVGGRQYAAFLYKVANGLLRRWDRCEISSTLHFILKEIACVCKGVYIVPDRYPDYSGLKSDSPYHKDIYFHPVVFDKRRQTFVFKHLTEFAGDRFVPTQTIYYWQKLRPDEKAESLYTSSSDMLRWVNPPRQPKNYRSSSGKRIRKLIPVVDLRLSSQLRVSDSSVLSWNLDAA